VYKYSVVFSWFKKKFAVGELTSPQVNQSTTWLTASWFVCELSSKQPLCPSVKCLWQILRLNQLTVCQVIWTGHLTDWPICELVSSPKCLTQNLGKTFVSVLHDAQLLLNKQQQMWGDVYYLLTFFEQYRGRLTKILEFGVNNPSKWVIYKFADGELTNLRIIQSANWPVSELTDRELVCWRIVRLPILGSYDGRSKVRVELR